MNIVLTAATLTEIQVTADRLKNQEYKSNGHNISVLITGIGGAMTTYALSRQLTGKRPDLVIQAGIAGSFTESLPPGGIAFVREELFTDLGALNPEGFVDIFDLGLADRNEPPFSNGLLINPGINYWDQFGLPLVRGATVNCVSSTRSQVRMIQSKYRADLESMEGAALHYVCLKEAIPFIQLRSISNFAGERDKFFWNIPEAIQILNQQLQSIFASLEDFPGK